MNDTKFYLDLGNEYPYDAPDAWWQDRELNFPVAEKWSHRAARGILADLTDRRDIKRGFENIDEDLRAEIVESISNLILHAYAENLSQANR